MEKIKNSKADELKKASGWDLAAKKYSKWLEGESGSIGKFFFEASVKCILTYIPGQDEEMILDLGCGDGRMLEVIERSHKNIAGVDSSVEMIKLARQRLPTLKDRLKVCNNDGPLQFAEDSVGLIISRMTLHLIKDIDFTFSEIGRVLSPQGRLVFTIPHSCFSFARRHLSEKKNRYIENFAYPSRLDFGFEQFVTNYHRPIQEYFRIITQNGFYVKSMREITPDIASKEVITKELIPYYNSSCELIFEIEKK